LFPCSLAPPGGRRMKVDVRWGRKSLYHRSKLLRRLFRKCMLRLFISSVSITNLSSVGTGKEWSKDLPSKVKATWPWLLQFLTTWTPDCLSASGEAVASAANVRKDTSVESIVELCLWLWWMDISKDQRLIYISLHSTSLASRARCIAFFRSGWPISSHHRITSWFQSAPLLGEVSNVINVGLRSDMRKLCLRSNIRRNKE
jgi:hypothetical protein